MHSLPSIQDKSNPAVEISASKRKGWADKVQSEVISQVLDPKS